VEDLGPDRDGMIGEAGLEEIAPFFQQSVYRSCPFGIQAQQSSAPLDHTVSSARAQLEARG
jgi:hypothetical protein